MLLVISRRSARSRVRCLPYVSKPSGGIFGSGARARTIVARQDVKHTRGCPGHLPGECGRTTSLWQWPQVCASARRGARPPRLPNDRQRTLLIRSRVALRGVFGYSVGHGEVAHLGDAECVLTLLPL